MDRAYHMIGLMLSVLCALGGVYVLYQMAIMVGMVAVSVLGKAR